MAESGTMGKVRIEDDFVGFEIPAASTAAPASAPYFTPGGFRVVGQGLAETDSGVIGLDSDGNNGVVQLTTTNEDVHTAGFQTNACFDMADMGGFMMEARVRHPAVTARHAFIGISDVVTDGLQVIEGEIMLGATTTLTLTASDLCGFYLSSDLTDAADWHGVYNGGSTTGATTSTDVDLDAVAVAGEFQILKLTIGPDGTARWYVDGVLKQTVTGAVSTTRPFSALCMIEANSTTIATMDVDYLVVESGRDWTV